MSNFTTWRSLVDGNDITLEIPDSENLHGHYDFSKEDGTTPVIDQSGNGFDLGEGSYSGVNVDINGVQAGEFDGSNDGVWHGGSFTDLRPCTVYAVVEGDPDGQDGAIAALSDDFHMLRASGLWEFQSNDPVEGTSEAGDKLLTTIDEGDVAKFREEGDQKDEGSIGSEREVTKIGVGNQNVRSDFDGRYFDGKIGEILLYEVDHDDDTADDVESYLANKWGITLS